MATCLEKFRDTKINEFSQKIPEGSYNVSDTDAQKEIWFTHEMCVLRNVLFRLPP